MKVLEGTISAKHITTKELCNVYRRLPKATDVTMKSPYHPDAKDLARFKQLAKKRTLVEVRKAYECRDGPSLLKQPWNTASERRLEALVRGSLAPTEVTVAEALLLNFEGLRTNVVSL